MPMTVASRGPRTTRTKGDDAIVIIWTGGPAAKKSEIDPEKGELPDKTTR
jgi:hypothetical protein